MSSKLSISSTYQLSEPRISSKGCDALFGLAITVATLATGSFITMAAMGYLQVMSALFASAIGLTDLVLVSALSCKKCLIDQDDHQEIISKPGVKDLPAPPLSVTPKPSLPLTEAEWKERLQRPSDFIPGHYNLVDPTQPVAPQTLSGFMALPTIGNYRCYGKICTSPLLGVRLPSSQLAGFPLPVQQLFAQDPNVELYFLVYQYSQDPEARRNLVMHHMAMPEFDASKAKQNPPPGPGIEVSWIDGLKCPTRMAIYDAQGIIFGSGGDDLESGKMKVFTPHFHGYRDDTRISPDTCIFEVDPSADISSFYTAAQFRGRKVAFFTVLINQPESPMGKHVLEATRLVQLSESIKKLESGLTCSSQISALFSYYP